MRNQFFETSPLDELESNEYYNLILDFCTFVCIVQNKKMNFPSIFVSVLENEPLRTIYMDMCGFHDEREAYAEFLKIDESITKSKFLKRAINDR